MHQFQQQNENDGVVEALCELSQILRCDLNKQQIEILLALADQGNLNGDALASIILNLREECLKMEQIEQGGKTSQAKRDHNKSRSPIDSWYSPHQTTNLLSNK